MVRKCSADQWKKRFRWCTIAKVKLSSAFKAVLILILLAHRTARPTPLATTHGRNFLRVRRIREQAHDAPPQVIFSPLVLCCCLPLSARQKGFPPWTHFLRAIPCNHAWHAVTDMSNVPRTPATPSVPPPEPCVCARVSKSAFPSHIHHTSSPDGKQAASPCLDFELLPVPTNYAAWADRVAIPVGVLS